MLILASASPRRRELLRFITTNFEVVISGVDEALPEGIACHEAVRVLASRKARAVAELRPGDVVIGVDTIVALDGDMLGIPRNDADAVAMLRRLSGREHVVHTGVCVITPNKTETFSQSTRVSFLPLTEREIADYVATGEPLDKAGAYGIQGKGALFVSAIDGDFYNVMGLPVASLNQKLIQLGIN